MQSLPEWNRRTRAGVVKNKVQYTEAQSLIISHLALNFSLVLTLVLVEKSKAPRNSDNNKQKS